MAVEMEPIQQAPSERTTLTRPNTYSTEYGGYSPITSGIPQSELGGMDPKPSTWSSDDGLTTERERRIWRESISTV